MRAKPDRTPEVVRVTTAQLSHTDDIALRQRRYVLTQLLRVVCIGLAASLPVAPAWKLVLLAGAILLPWFGVVAANAGPTVSRKQRTNILVADEPVESAPARPAIAPGRVIDAER